MFNIFINTVYILFILNPTANTKSFVFHHNARTSILLIVYYIILLIVYYIILLIVYYININSILFIVSTIRHVRKI